MTVTEIFRGNHRTIRRALINLERAVLMQTGRWALAARNLAAYLEIELREYWGGEERWVFQPLAATGPDAAAVVEEMLRGHRELEGRLAEFKALTARPVTPETAPLIREQGSALVKEFLHHMFVEEELGFALAEERLGAPLLEEAVERVHALREFAKGLEEPAAID